MIFFMRKWIVNCDNDLLRKWFQWYIVGDSPSVTPSTTKCNQAEQAWSLSAHGLVSQRTLVDTVDRKAGFKENVKTKSGGGLRRSHG
jgi:hypothetical protein